jgi:uncharacterized membrane protein YjfL (UPF0719 family)
MLFPLIPVDSGSLFGSKARTRSKETPAVRSRLIRQSAAAGDIPLGGDVIACLYILRSAADQAASAVPGGVEVVFVEVLGVGLVVVVEVGAPTELLWAQAAVRTEARVRVTVSRRRIRSPAAGVASTGAMLRPKGSNCAGVIALAKVVLDLPLVLAGAVQHHHAAAIANTTYTVRLTLARYVDNLKGPTPERSTCPFPYLKRQPILLVRDSSLKRVPIATGSI